MSSAMTLIWRNWNAHAVPSPWRRHQMETFSMFAGPLCGELAGHWWIPLRGANDTELLRFSMICAWIGDWVNSWEAGDLRSHRSHYNVTVMPPATSTTYKLHHIQALARLAFIFKTGPNFSGQRVSCFVISWGLEAVRFVSCGCSEIWRAPRQQCFLCAELSNNDLNNWPCDLETLRGLALRRLVGGWSGAMASHTICSIKLRNNRVG